MAAPDANSAFLASGQLAYGCTNLATAWPSGGTLLGLVGAVYVFPQSESKALLAEETNSAVEVLWLGGDVTVSLTANNWDNDALAFLFPNSSAVSNSTVVEWPGSDVVAGAPLTTYTNVVFRPNNTAHPGFILNKVAPVPEVNARLAMSAYRWLEVPAVLVALPDASGNVGKMGKYSVLSLP